MTDTVNQTSGQNQSGTKQAPPKAVPTHEGESSDDSAFGRGGQRHSTEDTRANGRDERQQAQAQEGPEQTAARARDAQAMDEVIQNTLTRHGLPKVPPMSTDPEEAAQQSDDVINVVAGQGDQDAGEQQWYQDPNAFVANHMPGQDTVQKTEIAPDGPPQKEFTAEEIKALLDAAGNAASNDLQELLSRVEKQPTLIDHVRQGEVKAAFALLRGGKRESPLPEQNDQMKKIVEGAKKYIGSDVRKFGKLNDILETGRQLGEARGKQREASAFGLAAALDETILSQQLTETAAALDERIQFVQGAPEGTGEDKLSPVRKQIRELSDQVGLFNEAVRLRREEADLFEANPPQIESTDPEELLKARLTEKGQARHEVMKAQGQEASEEKIAQLTEKFDTLSKEVAEDPNANREFKAFVHQLPYVFEANPHMYDQTKILIDEIKKRKKGEMADTLYTMLLMYLFGISLQQLQEGLN